MANTYTKSPINTSVVVWPAPQIAPRREDFEMLSLRICLIGFLEYLPFETCVLTAAT